MKDKLLRLSEKCWELSFEEEKIKEYIIEIKREMDFYGRMRYLTKELERAENKLEAIKEKEAKVLKAFYKIKRKRNTGGMR